MLNEIKIYKKYIIYLKIREDMIEEIYMIYYMLQNFI